MLRLKALEVAVVEVAKDHSYWCALTAGELENTLHLEIREHRAIKRKKLQCRAKIFQTGGEKIIFAELSYFVSRFYQNVKH